MEDILSITYFQTLSSIPAPPCILKQVGTFYIISGPFITPWVTVLQISTLIIEDC